MPNFDLPAIDRTATRYIVEGKHQELVERIGIQEFRNHVSCVFTSKGESTILSPWMPHTVPLSSFVPNSLVVGFTPTYPKHCPNSTFADNLRYRKECQQQLNKLGIPYAEAYGEALDFERSLGCFIAVVQDLSDLSFVLSNQLSCLIVDANGKTQLKSLID